MFDAATTAVAHMPHTEGHHVAERLHTLARRVGVLLPSIIEAPGVRLLAVVRTESTQAEVSEALSYQDSRGFRVVPSLDKPTTFGEWTEGPPWEVGESAHLARQFAELDVALRWAHEHGRLRNFVLLPLA